MMQLDRAKTALVLIDLQDNSLEIADWPVHEYSRILEKASALLEIARATSIEIAHVALEFAPGAYDIPPHMPRAAAPPHLSDLTDAISHPVQPRAGEAVFTKAYRSAFFETELHDHLISKGVDTLIIGGVWTDACIFASVIDAVRSGYRVILAEDAIGTGTQGLHQAAIVNMANRLYGGMITSADEIAGAIQECRPLSGWVFETAVAFPYEIDTLKDCYDAIVSEFTA